MKKIVASFAVVALSITCVFAQQEELKSAASNIEKEDYITALDDISKAKKKVSDLMTAQIAAVLPKKFGEFEMSDSDNMGYGMEGQGVQINKMYQKPVIESNEEKPEMMMGGNEPQLTVQITTDMMMASEVMTAHSSSNSGMMAGMEGQVYEPYRVKGYRALFKSFGGEKNESESEEENGYVEPKREEALAIVGGAFVSIQGQELEDGTVKSFMEQIDFEKLVGLVGK